MECTREGFTWIVQAPFTPENFARLVKMLINNASVPVMSTKHKPIGVIPQGSCPALQAVSATASLIAGLFFFRFWRDSHDRLFGFFGATFCLLALSWVLLALSDPTAENRPYIFAIRLVAFLLIIVAMIDKNRARPL